MGLLSYDLLEDGFSASANIFNQRFAKLYDEFNGNITSENLANGAVINSKIGAGAVTRDKLATAKFIDDNGWTVLDLGGNKTYTKEFATSGVLTLGEGTRGTIGTTQPPVGRTRDNISIVTTWYGGFSGHVIVGVENNGVSAITCQVAHNWPAPLTMNGRAILIASDKL